MKTIVPVALCLGLFLWSCGEAPPNEAEVDIVPAETTKPASEQEAMDLNTGETHSEAEEAALPSDPNGEGDVPSTDQ